MAHSTYYPLTGAWQCRCIAQIPCSICSIRFKFVLLLGGVLGDVWARELQIDALVPKGGPPRKQRERNPNPTIHKALVMESKSGQVRRVETHVFCFARGPTRFHSGVGSTSVETAKPRGKPPHPPFGAGVQLSSNSPSTFHGFDASTRTMTSSSLARHWLVTG